MKAEVATDKALADIVTLKDDAARQKIPLKFDFADATTALNSLKTELQAPTGSVHTVNDASVLKTQAEIDKLKLDTSSTHTVYVKSVEQHAAGGLIGAVQALATGGQVFRRQVGKIFGPGTGTSDSVPLMGSAGEFMVRAASVRKYGVAFLDNINRGLLPESLITQALAPAAAFAPQPATNNGGEMRITLHGPRGETARVTSERDEAMRLVRLLKSAGLSLA